MKKRLFALLVTTVLGITSIGGLAAASTSGFGSTGASAQSSYTLQDMLTYAIQDEYLAQAEYQEIIDSLDAGRPFTNIIKAEQQHINQLQPLFTAYDLEVPTNNAADYTNVPASLLEAFQAGVDAEVKNIAMYESFLKQELPQDVRTVFENLRDASEQHLKAFQRNVQADGNAAVPNKVLRQGAKAGLGQSQAKGLGFGQRQGISNGLNEGNGGPGYGRGPGAGANCPSQE